VGPVGGIGERFQQLASAGIRLDLARFKQWRSPTDQIAADMDAVVAEHPAATATRRYRDNRRQLARISAIGTCRMAGKRKASDRVLVRSGLREIEARVFGGLRTERLAAAARCASPRI
jgi:hypothetical protein